MIKEAKRKDHLFNLKRKILKMIKIVWFTDDFWDLISKKFNSLSDVNNMTLVLYKKNYTNLILYKKFYSGFIYLFEW